MKNGVYYFINMNVYSNRLSYVLNIVLDKHRNVIKKLTNQSERVKRKFKLFLSFIISTIQHYKRFEVKSCQMY